MKVFTRSPNQVLAWLLAALLFSATGGGLLARVQPGGMRCCSAGHVCCCVKAGLAQCACDGRLGPAAQLAALTTCSGVADLPELLLSPPPAVLPPASVERLQSLLVGPVPGLPAPLPPSAAPRPPTPPPQA